jgi:uncharacterized membrane protein
VIAGFALSALLFLLYFYVQGYDGQTFELFVLRWLHIGSGMVWVGLLWYFNFVSTPVMPRMPEALRPALRRYITPAALFWYRWSAMATLLFGIVLAQRSHYLIEACTLDLTQGLTGYPVTPRYLSIGIGMWLATIMWFNVWFLIWPNQKMALDIGDEYHDVAPADRVAAGKIAGTYSRINMLLSIPMLFCMVAAGHLY